ncbi:LysR family transcriptional regulator [Sphingobacterium sp. BN32]|uniref:LysR family transcriptional regulator n=1 Tax=Sphingobacterium sp. BN32 TaxID=3058432 RepID=UPI00265CA2EB|nr:LysR family transcriptional regulator [Sphingobacterium sp. BN32]WKK58135.1 LysR family transcriptional regulator [Sphingobacterium sp. BN32]
MLEVNFRIKVFYHAAKSLSFTKTSRELFISQPAVSKHIQELESLVGHALFLRNGNRLQLTEAGRTLMEAASTISKQYELLDYRLGLLNDKLKGNLVIGASTTLSQYILPQLIAKFTEENPLVNIKLYNGNTAHVTKWLFEQKIALGFVEGLAEDKSLKYTKILDDQLIFIARSSHPIFKKPELSIADFSQQEFVFREPGSGTNDIVFQRFKEIGIDAKHLVNRVEMSSSESIKKYIQHKDSIGILSKFAVKEEMESGKLVEVMNDRWAIARNLYLVHLHGEVSDLPKQFLRFLNRELKSFHNI